MSEKKEFIRGSFFGLITSPLKTGVFALCMILSFIIWGLLQLSEEHTGTFDFKVEFTDLPSGYEIDPSTPQNITVTIKTHGFKLLSYYVNKRSNSIKIPVNELIGSKSPSKKGIYLHLNRHYPKIAEGIGPDISITSILPDSIFLKTSAYQSKKVSVKFNGTLGFEPQYTNFGHTVIVPDSVTIHGIDTILTNIHSIYTETIALEDLNTGTTVAVGLRLPDGISRSIPDYVKIEIPVHRFTEKKMKLKVGTDVFNDSLTVSFYPSEVAVSVNVANEFYHMTDNGEFHVYCKWEEILQPNHQKLQVYHQLLTKLARVNKINPPFVDYIIHKK